MRQSMAVWVLLLVGWTMPQAQGAEDPLPASLDRLFPPQSATPIYREQMAELGFAYSAIFDDLEE